MKRLPLVIAALVTVAAAALALPVHHHRRIHAPAQQHSQSITVWVNVKTGIYHYPGERWYGRTRNGEYMTEAEARAHGYRPTRNGQ